MEISIYEPVDLIITLMKTTINGMTDRIRRLRQESFDTQPSLSIERALRIGIGYFPSFSL